MRNDSSGLFPAEQKEERETVILPPVPSYSLSSPTLSFSYPAFSEIKNQMEEKEKAQRHKGTKAQREIGVGSRESEMEKEEEVLPEPPLEKVTKTAEEPQLEPPLEKEISSAEIERELDRFQSEKGLVREAEKLLTEREALKKEEMNDLEPDLELANLQEEKPEAKIEPSKVETEKIPETKTEAQKV